ncbi:hypothetical protein N7462_005995 [Penicillium macrosclerotiorum]|uniref:uncharacterized protein n=1 Tax=Penicillium macrosclerotiorum TaxID=303699 RepID=UPI0025487434|nr:uncharacterized protein N7462_005995 [Penicillium macrosclerotiorum]KAJ5682830.1 hypothetical protein N7462_005995 [Penicillium macrosclerotiorum]
MPQLRRQPNPHDYLDEGSTAPGSLRAQFQTPPSRHTPSNPTQRLPPSTGPHELTPEAVPTMVPSGMALNPFSIFGRPRLDQRPPETVEEEEEFDDDYDPNVQDLEQDEYDDEMVPEDQLDEEEGADNSEELEEDEIEEDLEDQLEEEGDDEEMHDRGTNPPPPPKLRTDFIKPEKSPSPLPPNLREISSLASWTVSTSKPGCGVAALRHPSPSQYWQSDGPQPHTLTLHFFKLVAVVRIRVYLDFELDESYTPTKMIFLAGMGGNDLVEFATWEGDGPCGWVDVPLEGVGGRNGGWVRDDAERQRRRSHTARRQLAPEHRLQTPHNPDDENEAWDTANEDEAGSEEEPGATEDSYAGNVLKAMVIQMRVMENHQNGKDTHVRGFQVFACDNSRRHLGVAPSASADGRHRRHSARQSLRGSVPDVPRDRMGSEDLDANRLISSSGLHEPDWMGEPVIR